MPENTNHATVETIERLCRQLIQAKKQMRSLSGHTRTVHERRVKQITVNIEKVVEGLYATLPS